MTRVAGAPVLGDEISYMYVRMICRYCDCRWCDAEKLGTSSEKIKSLKKWEINESERITRNWIMCKCCHHPVWYFPICLFCVCSSITMVQYIWVSRSIRHTDRIVWMAVWWTAQNKPCTCEKSVHWIVSYMNSRDASSVHIRRLRRSFICRPSVHYV